MAGQGRPGEDHAGPEVDGEGHDRQAAVRQERDRLGRERAAGDPQGQADGDQRRRDDRDRAPPHQAGQLADHDHQAPAQDRRPGHPRAVQRGGGQVAQRGDGHGDGQ
jgi:hypothetical protein